MSGKLPKGTCRDDNRQISAAFSGFKSASRLTLVPGRNGLGEVTSMQAPSVLCSPASPLMPVIEELTRIAHSDAAVLLLGDTGTGKEVMARHVHAHSTRADKPFVAVNCGAIPEALLEAELFGHARGAFTGADRRREGRVALAEGGTLFLDEIGELSLGLQVKLLRLLQEKTYEPVGDVKSVNANFRLVAATNKDLLAEVEAGHFRRDLYYRLAVCPVTLPPLRERGDDVVVMFNAFWLERGEERPVDDAVFAALRRYAWPGNVRELLNLVERLRVCVTGPRITIVDLPAAFRGPAAPPTLSGSQVPVLAEPTTRVMDDLGSRLQIRGVNDTDDDAARVERDGLFVEHAPRPLLPVNLTELLRDLENEYIDAALEQTRGNRQAAAALLGLQRTTLVEKLKRREASVVRPVEHRPVA
jgi:sigma-54 specific flagellar transcriptional regulator A